MNKLEQAARQTLEALIVAEEFVNRHSEDWYISGQKDLKQIREAITAQREALADQAEQEPVGIVEVSEEWGIAGVLVADLPIGTKLYAAPVRTKDLSDDEIADALYGKGCWRLGVHPDHLREYRRVIAADREKNK